MKANKKKSTARRIARAIILLVVALLLYNIAGAYAPFIRCPQLDDPQAVEARADEMQSDIRTPDRVMLLHTHADALDERIRLMATAREEIVIATYDCRDGESTRDLLCVALERADSGVRVRLLVDGITGLLNLSHNPLFRAMQAHPNVEIRFYNPPRPFMPWHNMGRMHDKYVIVDDRAYILGGRNMFDSFIGDYEVDVRKDDREVLVYVDPAATTDATQSSMAQMRGYFESVWASDGAVGYIGLGVSAERRDAVCDLLRRRYQALREQRPELFLPEDYTARTLPTDGIWLICNPIGTYAKQPVVFSQLCALMDRAKTGIVIHSPYAVLNRQMRERLAGIAARTPVTLMVNAVEKSHNFVASSDYLYHRGEVLSTGVTLLEYAGDNYYHGKAVLIDDTLSIIGCYNLDLRSTYVDTELMLVVRGREFSAELRQSMDALHVDCRTVDGTGAAKVPEGLEIPPLPIWKKAALGALGALMQLVRNLV